MKNKFHIGDEVLVSNKLIVGDSFSVWCNEDMAQWAGYVATITDTQTTGAGYPCYCINIDHPAFTGFNKEWVYTEDMLEEVVQNDNDGLFDIDLICLIGGNT